MIYDTTHCARCGAALPAGAQFCPACGAVVAPNPFVQPPRPQPVVQRQPRRGVRLLLTLGACALGMVFVIQSGLWHPATVTSGSDGAPVGSTPRRVTYKVTGDGRASFTWRNAQDGTEQYDATKTPWERTYSMPAGAFVYLSAQNAEQYGAVTCEIDLDGVPFKNSKSIGAAVIASCSGQVP